ncbi:hypothetical protein Pcinc_015913 [Petrolisthes cinctipes]|uniref:G-protein coupled receptors family 2 profile 2 domain-containing protein n=1 Tax=Petrolisthes cinctipes TaxID=88211 RepID=A0AAE1FTC3_PETCI|nr:hypothetical protein Pcinc_015913 [Petrolisthes cinctipes]
MGYGYSLVWWVCVALGLLAGAVTATASNYDDIFDYDYTYGDESFNYEDQGDREEMPLCCPTNTLYHIPHNCSQAPPGWTPEPKLSGATDAYFVYKGFPKCAQYDPVPLYEMQVFFSKGKAFVSSAIHLDPIPPSKFCVTKVYDEADPEMCDKHQTKVFACLEKKMEEPGLYWTGVGIAHFFLVLTLLAFFLVRDLRCLQGQYMICFLISLLLYNICLLPGSVLTLHVSIVSCVSLGAVKYFFFSGVMLWFNVICFDVWRTLRSRQDVGSRKRFLLYSLYTWVVGAVLTTAILVTPYVTGKEHDSSLMETTPDGCKLKTDMNMVLLLVAGVLMVVDFIFLSLATSNICKYPRFGNGLPRSEASLSLKQGWKLFLIMIVHNLIDVPDDIFDIRVVDLWRYMLVESLAIFAVFAYRRTVLRVIYRCCPCSGPCNSEEHEMNHVQEKDQLTNGV